MNKKLQIIAPEWSRYEDDVRDLTAKVFRTRGNYWDSFFYNRQGGYYDDSHYRPEFSRIGILDGKVVTHYGVFDYLMRIGRARARVAGIGAVATHGQYRCRGLMFQTAQACVNDLAGYGFDFSILFGTKNFYHRFGYVCAWPSTSYTIRTGDLPKHEAKVSGLKKYDLRRHDDLDALYNRENRFLTGSIARPTYRLCQLTPGKIGYRWKNSQGKLSGYVVLIIKEDVLEVYEYAGTPDEVFKVLGRLAGRWNCRKIKFLSGVPYMSEVARRLRRENCERTTVFAKNGGAMIRTVNLRSALQKMEGELSHRLKYSHLANYKGSLLISDLRENVVIDISNFKAGVSERSPKGIGNRIKGGEEIAQLLIGSDEPGEIVERGKIKLSGEAKELLPVLFPNQHPTHVPWDYY